MLLWATGFCAHAQFIPPVDTIDQARMIVMYELSYREDTARLDHVGKEKMIWKSGTSSAFSKATTHYDSLKNSGKWNGKALWNPL